MICTGMQRHARCVSDCVEDWATGSARGIPDLLEIRGLQEVRLVGLVSTIRLNLVSTANCVLS